MTARATESELEVLRILWQAGRPLTRSEIRARLAGKTRSDGSCQILLNGMLSRNLLRTRGFARSEKGWARRYAPAMTEEKYDRAVRERETRGPAQPPWDTLRREPIDAATLDELEAMLDAARKALEDKQNGQ